MAAESSWISLALVAWPLCAAVGVALASGGWARSLAGVAAAGQLVLVGLVCLTFDTPPSTAGTGPFPVAQLAFRVPWLPSTGSELALAVDGLNQYGLLALAAVLAVAVAVDGRLEGQPTSPARLALALAATGGIALFLLTRDLMLAAAGHGMAGLALAALIGLCPARNGAVAARRFAVWAVSGSLLIAVAATLSGVDLGTTRLDELAAGGAAHGEVAATILLLALAMQIPLVPFHSWLAPVCAAGAVSGRVLVVGVWCGAGVFGILRFGLPMFSGPAAAAEPWPVVWAGLSAAYAAALALAQARQDLCRRAAWAVLSTGGLVASAALGMDSLQALGSVAFVAAQALPRAGLMLLAAWIVSQRAGGLQPAAAWTALALVFVAAPGGGVFPGWLVQMAGSVAAQPVLGWVLVVTTGMLGMALLVPVVGLARAAPGSQTPPHVRRVLILVLAVAVLTGLRPGPFIAWAETDVGRVLSGVPERVEEPGDDDAR